MFSRRRRGSSNPPVDRETHAAAAAAAVLASKNSHAALSSAAAAAALRSRTTTPEPVGNLVTKRMARRGSVSSVGSGSVIGSAMRGGVARGGLQRTNSGGSMTERTFRSPSPGGERNSYNGAVSPAADAPPVPALPRDLATRGGAHQRSSSMDPPQRMMSPPPKRGGRGASVDRGSLMTPATSRQDKRLSNVAEKDEGGNNGRVNFSRPMSSQQSSPVTASAPVATSSGAKKYTHGTGSWFSQPTGSGDATNARPRTADGNFGRKQKPAPFPTQPLPSSVSYDADDTTMVYDPNTRTFTAKPRAKPKEPVPPSPTLPNSAPPKPGTYDPNTRSIVPTQSGATRSAPGESTAKKQRPSIPPVETALEPPPRNPARISPSPSPSSPRAMGFLHHQPSIVREDPEGEDEAASTPPQLSARIIQTSAGPAKSYVAPSKEHQRSASLDVPKRSPIGNGNGRGRQESVSPARSAHFSPSPIVEAVRHDPPPRSISPVKSALKHHRSPSSSVRTTSPMATFSPTAPRAPASEVSDLTSNASEDAGFAGEPSMKKEKKRARVSFDEQPREIDAQGAVAVPKAIVTAIGGSLPLRDRSPAVDEELDQELMKPRPALPSFGSVRRGVRAGSPPEKVTEMPPEREGMSKDHAIAGILSNAHAQQKKDPEPPLPPDVTSNDAVNYGSDDSEPEESSFRPDVGSTPGKTSHPQPLQPRRLSVDELDLQPTRTRDFATENTTIRQMATVQDADVPAINLQPPTPGDEVGKELGDVQDTDEISPRPQRSFEAFNVPGSWAEESSDYRNVAAPLSTKDRIESILAQPLVEQPAPQPLVSEPVPVQTNRQPAPALEILDEESDDSGAFSDAAEDLSDLEGEGFGSLDAIVTSPIVSPTVPEFAASDKAAFGASESPSTQQAARIQGGAHSTQESEDWSKATAYWSQLSKEKKLQIEREAMSDDDEVRPTAPATAKKIKTKTAQVDTATAPTAMPKTLRGITGPTPVAEGENEVHMRRSMRGHAPTSAPAPAPQDDGVHMRRSMRGNTGNATGMAGTMRTGSQQRPQSEHIPQQERQNGPTRPMSSGGMKASRLGPGGLPLPQVPNRTRTDSESSMPGRGGQDSSFPKVSAATRQQPPPPRMQRLSSGGSTAPPAPSGPFMSQLQKQVTNDSDSESSFRKKRRRASQSTADPNTGRFNMKRSMRAGSIDSTPAMPDQRPTSPVPAAKRGGGAFSIRSLSPTGGGVFGRGKGEKLRESLRSGSVDATARGGRTTLRSNNAPSGPTMRTARPTPAPATAPSKSRFRSRFAADSDDEDDAAPRRTGGFRSRFADSDDDEPTSPPLRPVRGIPRRSGQDDGDSTDLEDEDGDGKQKPMVPAAADVEKAMEAARRKLGIPEVPAGKYAAEETKQGEALGKGSLRVSQPTSASQVVPSETPQPSSVARPEMPSGEKKKRSFMGSILRRNRSSQVSIPQLPQGGSPGAPASPPVAAPSSPQVGSPLRQTNTLPSSPSTGKLVRRTSGQPLMIRGESTFSNATAPVLRSKDSQNWPLAPPVPPIPVSHAMDGANRPNTSDGVNPEAIKLARTMRPDVGSRTQSAHMPLPDSGARRDSNAGRSVGFAPGSKEEDGDSASGGAGIYSKRTGKKKRFGMLRKAFGLYD
ncbi:hypothetical protein LTR10_002130 [Elasticomyces elasticus]|nr:hypothetical protein LTR10_002130 [Elasticomyces elasticus]KAK4973795.1 hypothetical protein LTR42_005785 [Elasticomyces elasticus]